jgi:uncharacterized protein YbjQ (UPF0145 family)
VTMNKYAVPLLTSETFRTDQEVFGAVHAVAVVSKSLLQDITANVKNWTVGGELNAYSDLIDGAVELAFSRLAERAVERGASAVVGVRLCSTEVAEGAAEVIAYGTLVRVPQP